MYWGDIGTIGSIKFLHKLQNSKLNFTEKESKWIDSEKKNQVRHISNYGSMLFMAKKELDDKDIRKLNRDMFKDFQFSIRENARDDISFVRTEGYESEEKMMKYLPYRNLFVKQILDNNEDKIVSYDENEWNDKTRERELVKKYKTEGTYTCYKIKRQTMPRCYEDTNFSLVKVTKGSGVNVNNEWKFLVYTIDERCDLENENSNKLLKELKEVRESKFVKEIVLPHFDFLQLEVTDNLKGVI
ncbi:hypothetical protein N9T49_00660 [bacterium]|jgi:hypothetical protein|nr:hypothetical protein [bacterium]